MDVDYERGTILEEADVTYFTILSEFSSYGSWGNLKKPLSQFRMNNEQLPGWKFWE
jgi:hypothetical protein